MTGSVWRHLALGVIMAVCTGTYSFAGSIAGSEILTQIKPLKLHSGINKVPSLKVHNYPSGQIIVTRRDNADAFDATHIVYQVVMPFVTTGQHSWPWRWHIVGIETSPGTVADSVHDNRLLGNALISVQFARGRVKNHPENLLFIAHREDTKDLSPTPVTMEVYQFIDQPEFISGDGTMRTPQFYQKILTAQTTRTYCNTDMAMHLEWGFALPVDYNGSKKDDGCRVGMYRRNINGQTAARELDPKWGVVFPGEKARELFRPCSGPSPENVTGTWTPDAAQIAELEKQLSPLLVSKIKLQWDSWALRAGNYYRQYGGYLSGGHRLIFVNGFGRDVFSPDFMGVAMLGDVDWTHVAVVVCDGGSSDFGAIYDADTKTFTAFGFHLGL